jgi:hypothetical protein
MARDTLLSVLALLLLVGYAAALVWLAVAVLASGDRGFAAGWPAPAPARQLAAVVHARWKCRGWRANQQLERWAQ